MNIKKILLAIDDSLYSQYAAETAWKLAKKTGASVVAMHVVDRKSAFDLIGQNEPGFLSKSDYSEQHDALVGLLATKSKKLRGAYETWASQYAEQPTFLVEQGNPLELICKAALGFDLVVIGHRPFAPNQSERYQRQFQRLSVAEALAHWCPKPLLVVQGKPLDWESFTIMTSIDHINRSYIDAALTTAKTLGLQPALVCLSTSTHELPPAELIKDLRESDPELRELPVAITGIDAYGEGDHEEWDNPSGFNNWDKWNETLLVAPTREIAGKRITVAGGSPSNFVRYCMLPAVLLWPEDRPHLVTHPDQSALTSPALT